MYSSYLRRLFTGCLVMSSFCMLSAQSSAFELKYDNSSVYAGIEVGSKGVKMSIVEIGKNAKSTGAFNALKDTTINTDFISFSQPTFEATLNGLSRLYNTVTNDYKIPAKDVYTVISSGVKMQAEKENKSDWINNLIDSFRLKIKDNKREVEVIDVMGEARLSHLGIVPDDKRYNTFLIDIGSGNAKGGYFPYGNTTDFKLFQLNWGTKSVANETEKRCLDDKTLSNFNRQLYRVLMTAENTEIIFAVNSSGSYPLSDNIAFSGGIAWSVATLIHPELIDKSVVTVTYDDVLKFSEELYKNYASLSVDALSKRVKENNQLVTKEVKRVHTVFDQKALMSGTGLLLKIMRQFVSVFESKQFYLVKNGQVGWITAYVDQTINK
ncbi:MAG: hypothetical protein ABIR18_10490 [Chitinophagaceae bacterium]